MIEQIAEARARLEEARVVLVLTGAGISAESGVPTFRGEGGLWRDKRPEDLATPEAFERDPRLVWEWYGWRRELIAACRPNPAHLALARWQTAHAPDVRIATQNVDGLHALAGLQAAGGTVATDLPLLEVHGTLFRTRCTSCGDRRAHREAVNASSSGTLPSCGACGGLLRPDVVWFGEALDSGVIGLAFEWAEQADVCLVIGTSALVHPAASLPGVTAESGGRIIEVNPDVTPLTRRAAVSIQGGAASVVPQLIPLQPLPDQPPRDGDA